MPSRNKQLLVFGDSNIGAVRRACDNGLLRFEGYDVEFWGAAGSEYRALKFEKGAIRATTKAAREMVLQVNEKGRDAIPAQAFDCYVFYGARLLLTEFFVHFLNRMIDPSRSASDEVLRRATAQFLSERRTVRMAQDMRAAGAKEIIFVSGGFPVWGVMDYTENGRLLKKNPLIAKATKAQRARIWAILHESFESLGFELIAQPDETVTNGLFTREEFAVEDAVQKQDGNHKAPSYAARLLFGRFG